MMYLFEFNNLSLVEKRLFVYGLQGNSPCKFISYSKELDQTISLWDCGSLFTKMYNSNKRTTKIESIGLNSSILDLYVDHGSALNMLKMLRIFRNIYYL